MHLIGKRSTILDSPARSAAVNRLETAYPQHVQFWIMLTGGLLLAALLLEPSVPSRMAITTKLVCDPPAVRYGEPQGRLPNTHYYFSKEYGWFDRSHFGTGNPGHVIDDVRRVVGDGGGTIVIHQGVQDGIIGFTGEYMVSGELTAAEITPAALAIYRDWSVRFESWQARPPHGLAAPTSSFAIEDLPSQYVGFFAAAKNLSIERVFACYLGPVAGYDEGPPALILEDGAAEDGPLPDLDLTWLQNRSFNPLVKTEAGWESVPWPTAMRLSALPSSGRTWYFLAESTWYLGESSEAPRGADLLSP